MYDLNQHIVENWEHFKSHFSFPYSHSIGLGNKDKIFQTETDLKNFIQNDLKALDMWMDHQWLQAASNLYNINIQILTTGIETPRWTKLQPTLQMKKPTINRKIGDIYLLHANNTHFDLLVPKEKHESLVLTEEEQAWMEKQINLIEGESMPTEMEVLRYELEEFKKQIKVLQEIVKDYASKAKQIHVPESKIDSQPEIFFENYVCGECGKSCKCFNTLEAHVRHEHNKIILWLHYMSQEILI